jgi:hypothetical protein
MTELEKAERDLAKTESNLRVAKRMPRGLWERCRVWWRATFTHWHNLLIFRTPYGRLHFWIKYFGCVVPCYVPECGHPATEFGQCNYHFATTKEHYRDAGLL